MTDTPMQFFPPADEEPIPAETDLEFDLVSPDEPGYAVLDSDTDLAAADIESPTEDDLDEGEDFPAPDLSPILARLDGVEDRLDQLSAGFQQLAKQVGLLPQQIRGLSNRVESVTLAISDMRVREFIDRLVDLYDLTDKLADTSDPGVQRSSHLIQNQIVQALRLNGVDIIPTDGHFDEKLHRVRAVEPCDTPEEDGEIIQVYQAGFFTEHQILRYADVVIKQFSDQQENSDS